MRVLFTSCPEPGHVHPMVPLARAFCARGDGVAWAVASEACPALRREGFEAMEAGLGKAPAIGKFFARFPQVLSVRPEERSAFTFPRLFGEVRAAPMLEDLLPLARQYNPSVIVHEVSELAGPLVAALLGVPSVAHSFGSLVPAELLLEAGERVAPLWAQHGLAVPPYAGSYEHLYIDIYPASLGGGAAESPHVPSVQPLRPEPFAMTSDEGVPEFLRRESSLPLVYVTLGTVFNKDVALLRNIVEGVRELRARIVVTVGAENEAGALGPQPENVHVARYIPHTAILPVCAAVVSHGGSGTFLSALAHGLPQVVVPQGGDQFRNAAACAQAGAGVVLPPGAVTATDVRDAARRVLDEPAFRMAAERVATEIRAMPSAASVAETVASKLSPSDQYLPRS
jgi:UDP:flavonoid glycosyltransferase YjiC (YdhE family)